MKTSTAFTATVVVAMLSLDATSGMKSFLQKFPNGDLAFTQALGHVGETESLNDFGKMFSAEGNAYTAKLCKSTFPGTSMTVGQAFGDPCCTWTAGGKPDFTVEPFTVPTKATTCAASAPAASSAGSSSAATTPAPSSATPSAGSSSGSSLTPSPASGSSSGSSLAPSPASGSSSGASTPAPSPASGSSSGASPTPSSSPSPKMRPHRRHKCGVKRDTTKTSSSDDDSSSGAN
jgi:hypothetical protein